MNRPIYALALSLLNVSIMKNEEVRCICLSYAIGFEIDLRTDKRSSEMMNQSY